MAERLLFMSLIPSPRHTKSDIACWAELERADRAHSHSRMLQRNWRRCLEKIKEFIDAGPCHCATSWGKDSVVTCYAVMETDPKVPLCWIRVEPVKSPECEQVRDIFLKKFPKAIYHEIEVQCRHDDEGWHATGTLEEGARRAHELFGTKRTILGIRAEESTHRAMRVYRYGENTANKSAPLGMATQADVFALMSLYDLPIHPAYAMLGGGQWPREHLRVASLGGHRGRLMGRYEWEQRYYGDELRRLGE